MSQANSNMFGADFFPTPRPIARRMVAKISHEAKYFLEPSAGKGNIADVIKRPMTEEEFDAEHKDVDHEDDRYWRRERYACEERRVTVDVIEQHPALIAVLRDKGYPVVGYDWLDYVGVSYYDACVMNPPFGEGAKHLLKAWDFMHNGEIVCLLNAETIDNPYTEERKRLAGVIAAAGGEVERLGTCFDTAERKTNVEVAMVYLKKVALDDTADMWAREGGTEKVYNVEVGDDPNFLAIRDNLANMEHWYNMANEHWVKGIEHLRRARLYMNQNKIHDYQQHGSHESDFKVIAGMGLDNANTSRTEFLRRHRLLAWTSVFNQMEFSKWLDSKQQEQFMRDVERDATIPFTAQNIQGTLENVFLSRKKLFDESVANVFDELCSHAVENGSGPKCPESLKNRRNSEGWKTNDSYKVNERLIFPWGCRFDKILSFGFSLRHGDSGRIYTDLDRILCVLDAHPWENCRTVGDALHSKFQKVKSNCPVTDQVTESQYFEIRFFKKGTVHLKWKRMDLLERFNIHAAAGKKWLGENTQQYRPPKAKEEMQREWLCRKDGCDFKDGLCTRCENVDEAYRAKEIPCELCRAVYEATGEKYCPIHPKPGEPAIAQPAREEPRQIAAPDHPSHGQDYDTCPHCGESIYFSAFDMHVGLCEDGPPSQPGPPSEEVPSHVGEWRQVEMF